MACQHGEENAIASLASLKRFSTEQYRYRQAFAKNEFNEKISQHLFALKENVASVELKRRRPVAPSDCACISGISNDLPAGRIQYGLPLRNILLQHWCESSTLVGRTFSHLYHAFSIRAHDYRDVSENVLKHTWVTEAIKKVAEEQANECDDEQKCNGDTSATSHSHKDIPATLRNLQHILSVQRARAQQVLAGMHSKISNTMLRLAFWVLCKFMSYFVSRIALSSSQADIVREASKTGLPLVMLPLHRSHLDYLLASYAVVNMDVRAPLVAAGDNMKISVFGNLLRRTGAFFIKRRLYSSSTDSDVVYKAILRTYITESLKAGHNIEIFLEGGRSRTGKPCMPKCGILSIIVDAITDGTIDDVLLIPMGISYEKLAEGHFITEQMGHDKQMESFTGALRNIWRVVNDHYGIMRVDFSQPFSLRSMVAKLKRNTAFSAFPQSSAPETDASVVDEAQRRLLIESISNHVVYNAFECMPIMSTNALSFLMLFWFPRGQDIPLDKLVNALDQLRENIFHCGRDVGFTGKSEDVIRYNSKLMGSKFYSIVRQSTTTSSNSVKRFEVVRPMYAWPDVIALSYYANTLVAHYSLKSALAYAINRLRSDTTTRYSTKATSISYRQLSMLVLDVCNILRYEFLWTKPCQQLADRIDELIHDFYLGIGEANDIGCSVFLLEERNESEMARKSRQIAKDFDEESDEECDRYDTNGNGLKNGINGVHSTVSTVDDSCSLVVNDTDSKVVEYLDVMGRLLVPLLDTYVHTARVATKRLAERAVHEKELVRAVINEMREQHEIGKLQYMECASADPIKNALRLFQSWGYIECHIEKNVVVYHLRSTTTNVTKSMEELNERLRRVRV